MTADYLPLTADRLDAFRALFAHPDIFPAFASRGDAASYLSFPHTDLAGSLLAFDGDTAVGFALSLYVFNGEPPFVQTALGVLPSHRRRGIARELLSRVGEHYGGRVSILRLGVDAASDVAKPFAESQGFRRVRTWWRMRRPVGPVPDIVWPDGITTRTFDRSEAMLDHFRHVVHTSFAENWGFVPWTMEIARQEIARPGFRPEGVLFAYRSDAPVGISVNTLHGEGHGEVDTLGVLKQERGSGLGRALLRWGVRWLQQQACDDVFLLVDGENDSATRLYRSEGFSVASERHTWERALAR